MAVDYYATAKDCSDFAHEHVKLRRSSTALKVFSAKKPLEFVSIDKIGDLIRSKSVGRWLLVISVLLMQPSQEL